MEVLGDGGGGWLGLVLCHGRDRREDATMLDGDWQADHAAHQRIEHILGEPVAGWHRLGERLAWWGVDGAYNPHHSIEATGKPIYVYTSVRYRPSNEPREPVVDRKPAMRHPDPGAPQAGNILQGRKGRVHGLRLDCGLAAKSWIV